MTKAQLLTLLDGLAEDAHRDGDPPVSDIEIPEAVWEAARRERGLLALARRIEVVLLGHGRGLRVLRERLAALEHEARTVEGLATQLLQGRRESAR